jgi:hypothetical protein
MSRAWISVDSQEALLDAVADISHDAYDEGLSTDEIVVTLQRVEDEIINREELDRRADEIDEQEGAA